MSSSNLVTNNFGRFLIDILNSFIWKSIRFKTGKNFFHDFCGVFHNSFNFFLAKSNIKKTCFLHDVSIDFSETGL